MSLDSPCLRVNRVPPFALMKRRFSAARREERRKGSQPDWKRKSEDARAARLASVVQRYSHLTAEVSLSHETQVEQAGAEAA